jgi:hypothetical protein
MGKLKNIYSKLNAASKAYLLFVFLDILELLCFWRLTSEIPGPLDAQGLSFYICMIFIYPLVICSGLLYIGFIIEYRRLVKRFIVGTILNIHVFVIFYKYANHFIRLWIG